MDSVVLAKDTEMVMRVGTEIESLSLVLVDMEEERDTP
jgi:hypothetical protein